MKFVFSAGTGCATLVNASSTMIKLCQRRISQNVELDLVSLFVRLSSCLEAEKEAEEVSLIRPISSFTNDWQFEVSLAAGDPLRLKGGIKI